MKLHLKATLIGIALLVLGIFAVPTSTLAYTRVRGYIRRSGTYVAPHYRSSPNRTKHDNWSSQGNVNPFTGKRGYKRY